MKAFSLIFCIPLIYHRELGFISSLSSVFTLYVFQASDSRGDCTMIVWAREGSWGCLCLPNVVPGKSKPPWLYFPPHKGESLKLKKTYFLKWGSEGAVILSIGERTDKL